MISPLLTDLYQLTMAHGYWASGMADREAVFHLFFRRNPFKGGYALTCGLGPALDFAEGFRFGNDDLDYLATLHGNDGSALFPRPFLDFLRETPLAVDIDAIPEGTPVFPHEPLLRVQGPLYQCQLLESALLNIVNFQTLVATKASRVAHAAAGQPVLEFGLRRAQGIDGALAASRAAYIGGCAATSNVLAGKQFGIPVRGTHAHSWVMSFESEPEAFAAYADAMPNNAVFLVDTYDTLEGVRHAIAAGRRLEARGHKFAGIRLDSGDLAYLSVEARRLLDEAGFRGTAIIASNDLDEHLIESLRAQGAAIGIWGVGTRLVTAYDEPALGGVFKLAAIRNAGGAWEYKMKLSEQGAKCSIPGILGVRRFESGGLFAGDAIHDGALPAGDCTIVDPADPVRQKRIPAGTESSELLEPALRKGRRVAPDPPLTAVRDRASAQLAKFHPAIRRFANPHSYPAGLEMGLHGRRTAMIARLRS